MLTEYWWLKLDVIDVEDKFFANRTVQSATQNAKQWYYCRLSFQAVSFIDLAIKIGHQDRAIYRRWTFFFGKEGECLRISLKQLIVLKRK